MTDQPSRPKGKTGRPACRAALDLPIPPSGRIHRSDEYQHWLQSAGRELKAQRPIAIPSPVALRLQAGLLDMPQDLDSVSAAVCDLLQAHGVVENDVAIVDLRMRWDRVVPTGRVHIELWRTLAPASRIGAETRAKVSAGCKAAFSKRAAA